MRLRLYPGMFAFLTSLTVAPGAVLARTPGIYINDVRVDGLTGQTFTNVDVTFDANGDVRITAKGYKIQSTAPDKPPVAPPGTPTNVSSTHRFYIASTSPPGRSGMAGWDIDVYVNQVFVRKFRSSDPEPIFDLTKFLKPGSNVIHFTAKKEEGERKSTSPNDYFELVIGDGETRAGQVMLNKISAYRRTAAESGVFNTEITLNLMSAPSP